MKAIVGWVAACLAAASVPLASAQTPVKEQAGIRWVCGGVGADARRDLAGARFGESMVLVFATQKRGAYLAGARVWVRDAASGADLATFVADGPICLLAAPPGRYRIEASFGKIRRSAAAAVAVQARSAQRIVLAFPEGPWDGIRADEEEKRQAREP